MRRALVVSFVIIASASTAVAEQPPGGYEDNQQVQYYDPNAPPPPQGEPQYGQEAPQPYDQSGQPVAYDQYGQPVQEYPQQEPAEPVAQTAREGRGLQYGATVFSPIWLGDINDQVSPGIGIHGRLGWEVGAGLSLELGIGAMVNPDSGIYYDGSLTNIFFTGGARYAFLNPSALVPFVQAALQVNLFNSCYEDDFGTSVCGTYGNEVTVGFNAGAGLIWEINQNAALEGGLNVAGTPEGTGALLDLDPMKNDFWIYLSPFIGFTLYY